MFFQQVLYRDLGCASYMLGDGEEAVVVDPRWDIDVYLEIANRERMRITHVVDTHDHADHVSGRLRLAEATGARVYRPAREGEQSVGTMSAGAEIVVGAVRMRALATPGHRPEHLAFAVYDLSRGSEPWLLLTGDSLLVGDVARPDLVLEAETGARALHASLKRLLALGDHVEIWPAHVGGSLCGGTGLSGKTSSTIGFERHHNPLLQTHETEFVRGLTASIPPRPPNVERIVALNSRGRLESAPNPPALDATELRRLLTSDVTVLDGRLPSAFDACHVAGAINLPVISAGVGTRAGWALRPDEPIVIVADGDDAAAHMIRALQAVGLWEILGYVVGEGSAWERHGLPVAHADSWDVGQLVGGLRSHAVDLIDVRDAAEWVAGHVPGSRHLPLHRLGDGRRVDLADNSQTTAVACTGGIRAAFAASVLRRAGGTDVVRVAGGGIGDLAAHGVGLEVGAG